MATTQQRAVKALSPLYRIIEAGEKGYAVAGANVSNRGLKVLFKSYAQQRANFKSEILAEIKRLGGDFKPRSSTRGIIHRGRIAIVAALTIGAEAREIGVLKEVVLGEKAALRTYEAALKSGLPAETQAIVERQLEAVQQASEQVNLMLGQDGKRLVVRLLNTEKDAEMAVQALEDAGFSKARIEKISLTDAAQLYQGRGTTVSETIVSGAFGGSLWGSIFGAVAGIGVVQTPGVEPVGDSTILGTWALIALSGIVIGAFIGAALGFFIGVGVSEEDTFVYGRSIQHGQIIIRAVVDEQRASEAGRIMARVNIESRSPARGAMA